MRTFSYITSIQPSKSEININILLHSNQSPFKSLQLSSKCSLQQKVPVQNHALHLIVISLQYFFHLAHFLSLPLTFMTLTILKTVGQYFVECPLWIGLVLMFLVIMLRFCFLSKYPTEIILYSHCILSSDTCFWFVPYRS